VQDVGPWYLLSGHKAFNNKANLAGSPLAPLDVDERGRPLYGSGALPRIWTGSKTGGTLAGAQRSCSGWMDGTVCYGWNNGPCGGVTGSVIFTDTAWIDDGISDCDEEHHLLCIEQ